RAQGHARGARTRTGAKARCSRARAEVIEAAAKRHRRAARVAHHEARRRFDGADARKPQTELASERLQGAALVRGGGKGELVVLAAGEHAVALELGITE